MVLGWQWHLISGKGVRVGCTIVAEQLVDGKFYEAYKCGRGFGNVESWGFWLWELYLVWIELDGAALCWVSDSSGWRKIDYMCLKYTT
jgi:hypothetical protein